MRRWLARHRRDAELPAPEEQSTDETTDGTREEPTTGPTAGDDAVEVPSRRRHAPEIRLLREQRPARRPRR